MIFGRRDTWAIEIDPLGGSPAEADSAAAATWCAIRLWVNGRNLTAHARAHMGTTTDALHWPAAHLARWFISAWPGLWERAGAPLSGPVLDAAAACVWLDQRLAELGEDISPDELDRRDAFVESHALAAAAAGGVMPDVYLFREGRKVHVSWRSAPDPSSDIRFLEAQGRAIVEATTFLESIEGFAMWVADAVVEVDRDLSNEIQAWSSQLLSPRAAEALLIGYAWPWASTAPPTVDLDAWFTPPEGWRSDGARFDPTRISAAVVFRALSPIVDTSDVCTLLARLATAPRNAAGAKKLSQLQHGLSVGSLLPPHRQGYVLAEDVRRRLGNRDSYLDIEGLLSELGVAVREDALSDEAVDAAAVWDDNHGPVIVLNTLSSHHDAPWARRMSLAHELCHLLVDREEARPLTIVSSPWAPPELERRANAFAAELLIPKAGLLRAAPDALHRGWVSEAKCRELMKEFAVGSTVCAHQLENRLRVSTTDA